MHLSLPGNTLKIESANRVRSINEIAYNFISYPLISMWNSISFRKALIFISSSVALSTLLTKLANISLNAQKWMHIEMNNRNSWIARTPTALNTIISTTISPTYPTMDFWFHGRLQWKKKLWNNLKLPQLIVNLFSTYTIRTGWNKSTVLMWPSPYFSWEIEIDAIANSTEALPLHFVKKFMEMW